MEYPKKSLELLLAQRQELLPPLEALLGEGNIVENSHLVMKWMGDPGADPIEIARLFDEFPAQHECDGLSFDTALYDLHQLLAIRQLQGEQYLHSLLDALGLELLIVGMMHNHESIAKRCAERVQSTHGQDLMFLFQKNSLTVNDVGAIVTLSSDDVILRKGVGRLLERHNLHDPDANNLSCFLSRVGNIRCARLLYFAVPDPSVWPLLQAVVDAPSDVSVEELLTRLFYSDRSALYGRFSWHIQSTVLRVVLLALLWEGRSARLGAWKNYLGEGDWGYGHHGSAEGFQRGTLKMLDTLSRTWQQRAVSDGS